jgi:hypothetical protein
MVTTRKQEALQAEEKEAADAPDNLTKRPAPENSSLKPTENNDNGQKSVDTHEPEDSEPPTKKVKIETPEEEITRKDEESERVAGKINPISWWLEVNLTAYRNN